jgi:hypothetical protein
MAEEREQMMAKDFSPESGNSLPPKRDAVKITAILSERPILRRGILFQARTVDRGERG